MKEQKYSLGITFFFKSQSMPLLCTLETQVYSIHMSFTFSTGLWRKGSQQHIWSFPRIQKTPSAPPLPPSGNVCNSLANNLRISLVKMISFNIAKHHTCSEHNYIL